MKWRMQGDCNLPGCSFVALHVETCRLYLYVIEAQLADAWSCFMKLISASCASQSFFRQSIVISRAVNIHILCSLSIIRRMVRHSNMRHSHAGQLVSRKSHILK